jgi:hypothetical protein
LCRRRGLYENRKITCEKAKSGKEKVLFAGGAGGGKKWKEKKEKKEKLRMNAKKSGCFSLSFSLRVAVDWTGLDSALLLRILQFHIPFISVLLLLFSSFFFSLINGRKVSGRKR